MVRAFLLASTALVFCGPAWAQQYYVQPQTPQMVVVAQPPQVRNDLGGGFIEYVFGDRPRGPIPAPQYIAPPQYAPPQQTYVVPQQPAYPAQRQAYANTGPVDPMLETRRPDLQMDPRFLKQEVAYDGKEEPGTIVIDTPNHFLYLVQPGGRALRYGVGVGRPGFTWAGTHTVSAKKEWPDWTPPKEMLERQPYLPRHMEGGPNNPLGARAMYLGSTLYRIHGSNEPWTIGHNVSSGCIRMRNVDVIDLYDRVKVGAKVVVM
jgi:lipoprotein-anchoring transpeptidase ErfK/SrfK